MSKLTGKLTNLTVFGILVAIAWTGYTHFANNPIIESHDDEGLVAELQTLHDRLSDQQLKNARQNEEIRRLTELLAQSESVDDWSCENDSVADDLSSPEQREQTKEFIALRADEYEHVLAEQSIDYEQGDELRAEIVDFLAADSLSGSTLVDSRCGEALCRVELHHSTEQAFEAFVSVSPSLFERRGETFVQVIESVNGANTTVLFLSKDGFGLPLTES